MSVSDNTRPRSRSSVLALQQSQARKRGKEARMARQKALVEALNESPHWFGLPRQVRSTESKMTATSDDDFSSFVSESPLLGNRKRAFIGLQELTTKNIFVILWLWFIRFLIPWVEAWHEYNVHLLADPLHLSQHESYFASYRMYVFIGKCVICIVLSIIVDCINFKYPTYFIILPLYMFTPVIGATVVVLLRARVYDSKYYHEFWHLTIVAMMCATSFPFVVFPLQFTTIFNQEKNMSRMAHYNWTAVFGCVELLNAAISCWTIPPSCPTSQVTLMVVWGVIAVIIVIVIIEILSVMRWAHPESMKLLKCKKEVKESNKRIKFIASKPTRKHKPVRASFMIIKSILKAEPDYEVDNKTKKLFWFILVLVPVIFTSFVFEILQRARTYEDCGSRNVTTTNLFITGEFVGVVVTFGIIIVIRKHFRTIQRVPLLNPNVLALGLPFFINTLALAVILGQLMKPNWISAGDVILGPVPTREGTVLEFYNVEIKNRSLCVHSEFFGPLKIPPHGRSSAVINYQNNTAIRFNVTLDPHTTPMIITPSSFNYEKGEWLTYVITIPPKTFSTEMEFHYSSFDVIKVKRAKEIHPEKEPQVVFINPYETLQERWHYNVTGPTTNEIVSEANLESAVRSYPPGKIRVTYTAFVSPHPPVSVDLVIEKYCVYTVLPRLATTNTSDVVPRWLQTHKTMEIAGPVEQLATKAMKTNAVLMFGMGLAGMAKGGIYIGWIYLFWLDYPLTGLRTTFLAVFWILMAIPVHLAREKMLDIGMSELKAMLAIQAGFTCFHFLSATFLYQSSLNLRERLD